MSEHDELPPPLSPDASAFLAEHAGTGAPPPEQLARVRGRLQERVLARRKTPSPARAVPQPRRWLRSELMAAAAVVALIVLGQGAYLLSHQEAPPPVPALTAVEQPLPKTPAVGAVLDLYRVGKLADAQRLAKAQCSPETCGALESSLERVAVMTARLEELTSAELHELAELDLALGGEDRSPVGALVEQKRRKLPVSTATRAKAASLSAQAEQLRQAKELERARDVLQLCLLVDPGFPACARQLGSVYAALAALDQSAQQRERARAFYERFLEVATPTDPDVAKVKALLDAAGNDGAGASAPEQLRALYLHGYSLRSDDPEGARRAFREVLELAQPGSEWAQKARMRLEELGEGRAPEEPQATDEARRRAQAAYQRARELEDVDRAAARRALDEAVRFSELGSDLNRDARAMLRRLSEPAFEDGEVVALSVGGRHTLALRQGVQRVAVGDPNVADVVVAGPQALSLQGVGVGKTTLLVWYFSGQRQSFLLTVSRR